MIIECEEDPNKLIDLIGDPCFSICEGKGIQHENHPKVVRISDAEGDVYIDVYDTAGRDSIENAQALCKLLNQDYRKA
jgi:hypothetical protein